VATTPEILRSAQPRSRTSRPGKSRINDLSGEWVNVMMPRWAGGKAGLRVFYGHPGIFAWSPHKVIELARAEGYQAHMEAGVSAEVIAFTQTLHRSVPCRLRSIWKARQSGCSSSATWTPPSRDPRQLGSSGDRFARSFPHARRLPGAAEEALAA